MQHSYGAGMMMNLGGRMLKSQQGDSFAFQDSLMGVGTRFCVCVCVCNIIYTYYIIYMQPLTNIYIYRRAWGCAVRGSAAAVFAIRCYAQQQLRRRGCRRWWYGARRKWLRLH
jgi:hypothetical protein